MSYEKQLSLFGENTGSRSGSEGNQSQRDSSPLVWKNLPVDKHFWAFYYFCSRKGDYVEATFKSGNVADLKVFKGAK